jgi:energy-coupling factor transport system ATP-binding protein
MSEPTGSGKGNFLYQLEEVSFSYPERREKALNKVSFRVRRGEKIAIIGPCGAGKSTLLEVLASLLLPDEGEVLYEGNLLKKPGQLSGEVGLLFQFPEKHFFETTVFQEVTLTLRERGFRKSEVEERYGEVMRLVGLDPEKFKKENPFKLSLGEKRRLALASILSFNPSILLLDEPLAGLDGRGKSLFLSLFEKMSGKTIFLVTQEVSHLERIAERIIFLKRGEIIFDQPVKGILKFSWDEEDIPFLPFLHQLSLLSGKRMEEVREMFPMGVGSCEKD